MLIENKQFLQSLSKYILFYILLGKGCSVY